MPQREFVPQSYELDSSASSSTNASLQLTTQEAAKPLTFTFEAVRPNLFRTTYTSETHPLPPYPSVRKPATELGQARVIRAATADKKQQISVNDVCVEIDWASGAPCVQVSYAGAGKPLHQDLPYRGYGIDGDGVVRYTRCDKKTLHVGLGEKAAPMNLTNRNFALSATDSFGYDVYRTDPLYKNIPFLINATPQGCVALFSTSHARGTYTVGCEMDGMWGSFKVYRQDFGGLEEYMIVGKTIQEVVHTYAELVGFPLLVPRWAFGYLSGGMKYSMLDEPRAADALMGFADKLRQYDIPCSGMQLSSGYTVAETEPKTRNVFTWNRHRFPDPEAWVKQYHERGLRIIANIKPYILANHPEYQKLVDAGALFTDVRKGQSAQARLWSAGGGESGIGGHIDFTSEAGFKWWYNGVQKLRKEGIDCMWNDNNEYVISDDMWQCALNNNEHVPSPPQNVKDRKELGLWGRAMHTELHGKASHDALVDLEPEIRPFVLTRSSTAGTNRYACSSWSGDNVTSWKGMKGANAIALTAGTCLMHCYGHDVGGFEGPQPSPELLVRWTQLATYSPRFAINCYKTSPEDNTVGDVIEPWMYESTLPLVRGTIKRRYELQPYIYSAALESHLNATPPMRWIGWGYETTDPEVWTPHLLDGEEQYWFGTSMLVGGVYEPGLSEAKLYLPTKGAQDAGYINMNHPHQYLSAGQWVTLSATWDDEKEGIPLLALVGGAIPIGKDIQTLSPGEVSNPANLPADDYRGVEIFPAPRGTPGCSLDRVFSTSWYEDDGMAAVHKNKISKYTIRYSANEKVVKVEFEADESSGYVAPWSGKGLSVVLPVGDTRDVVSSIKGLKAVNMGPDSKGRRVFQLEKGEQETVRSML